MNALLRNGLVRALCVLALGIFFTARPEAARWFTIAVGVAFAIPGAVALAGLFDRHTTQRSPGLTAVVATGCVLFGLALAVFPDTFTASLMYVLAAALAVAAALEAYAMTRLRREGSGLHGAFFAVPALLLGAALFVAFYRDSVEALPPFIVLGAGAILYALAELFLLACAARLRRRKAAGGEPPHGTADTELLPRPDEGTDA